MRGTAFAIFAFLSLGALIPCVCLVFFNDDDIEPSDVVIDKPEKMGEVAGGDSLDFFEQLILDNPCFSSSIFRKSWMASEKRENY